MRNWCKTTINKSIIFTWLSTLVNRIYDFEGCLSDCTKNFYSVNASSFLIGVLKRYAWFIKYFLSWINTKQRWYVFSLIKKNRFAQITDTFVHQIFEIQEKVTMSITHMFLTKPKRTKACVNGNSLLDVCTLVISLPSLVPSGTNCLLVMGV